MISIHKALAGLDHRIGDLEKEREISIHKALAGLDPLHWFLLNCYFISIHKALAGLDGSPVLYFLFRYDFNPQGPRGPRLFACFSIREVKNFNPQGPRGPRPNPMWYKGGDNRFQSTRPSRASTVGRRWFPMSTYISIHKALAGLDVLRISMVVPTG